MMTPEEAIKLVAFVRAAAVQQHWDEYSADAWRKLLDGYHFDECMEAAVEQGRASKWIAPCDIIRIVELKRFLAEPE